MYFIIKNIESIIDKYNTGFTRYSGVDSDNQLISVVVQKWVLFNIGDKLHYTEENDGRYIKRFLVDATLSHPTFQLGGTYQFEFVGYKKKANDREYLLLRGIDNLEYEVPRTGVAATVIKSIGAKYNLIFISIIKGRIILQIENVFYDVDYFKSLFDIKSVILELSSLADSELYFQSQLSKRDNRWIISFLNEYTGHLNSLLRRKNWLEFNKKVLLFFELENWILNSGYLNLYNQETRGKIKMRVNELLKRYQLVCESVQLIIHFKDNDYISNLSTEKIGSDSSQIVSNLIYYNGELLDNNNNLIKIYEIFCKNIHPLYLIKSVLVVLEAFFKKMNRKYASFEFDAKEKGEILVRLIYVCRIIHDLAILAEKNIVTKTYLSKLLNLYSELNPSNKNKFLELRNFVFHEKYLRKKLDSIEIGDFDTIQSLFINDNPLIINEKLNDRATVVVLSVVFDGASVSGCFVRYKSKIGILHKKRIFPEIIDSIRPGFKLNVFIEDIISEINLYIFSQYINSPARSADSSLALDYNYVGLVTSVERYGLFISTPSTNTGLLHYKNMHDSIKYRFQSLFSRGNKISVSVTSISNQRIEFGNISIIQSILDTYKEFHETSLQFIEFNNDYVNILFSGDTYYPFLVSNLVIDHDLSINEISSIVCYAKIDGDYLFIKNISNVERKDSESENSLIESNELLGYLHEITAYLEEISHKKESYGIKIKYLQRVSNLYGFFFNYRSYFIKCYIDYLNILIAFSTDKAFSFDKYEGTLHDIISDEKLKTSFKSVKPIIDHLTLIKYFDDYSKEAFYKIVDYMFEEVYQNISTTLLKYKLETKSQANFDKRNKLISKLSFEGINPFIFDKSFDDLSNISDPDNLYLLGLIKEINTGENKYVEFKSSFYTPIQNGKFQKTKSDALIHSVMKNIVAFVNTDGGKLFIGVSDSGEIIGLEGDLSYFIKGSDLIDDAKLKDLYRTTIDSYLSDWVGNDIRRHIKFEILTYQNKDFCVFTLSKKDRKRPYLLFHSIDKMTNKIEKNKKVPYFRGEGGAMPYSNEDLLDLLE